MVLLNITEICVTKLYGHSQQNFNAATQIKTAARTMTDSAPPYSYKGSYSGVSSGQSLKLTTFI